MARRLGCDRADRHALRRLCGVRSSNAFSPTRSVDPGQTQNSERRNQNSEVGKSGESTIPPLPLSRLGFPFRTSAFYVLSSIFRFPDPLVSERRPDFRGPTHPVISCRERSFCSGACWPWPVPDVGREGMLCRLRAE